MASKQRISVIPGRFAVCRLPADAGVPPWALDEARFVSVTRTDDELSIVCEEDTIPEPPPEGFRSESGFTLFKIHGPFPLNAVGILASVATSLAEAGISLLAIGTFDTDYLLVSGKQALRAADVLGIAGHEIIKE
jgi:hypothetical protein